MRRTMLVAVACAVLLVPVASLQAQAGSPCSNGNKVALVNSARVLSSIPAYLQAESLFTKEMDGYKADITKQRAALDSASNAYAENSTLLNSAAKNAAMKKLQDQNDALQKHMADLQAKADQRQAELVQPIQTRVQEVLDGVRALLGCSIVFDVGPQAQSGIASADKTLDITDRVIDLLRSTSPAPVKPADKPPAPGGIKPPGGGGGGGGGELPAAALPATP
jgi:Skp family chaperone for outer membrane proteins